MPRASSARLLALAVLAVLAGCAGDGGVRDAVRRLEAEHALTGTAEVRPLAPDGRLTIALSGGLNSGMTDAIESAVARERPGAVTLDLHLFGGNDYAAREILAALAPVPELTATVTDGHECGSACLTLWFNADRRFAAPTALFGFHGRSCASTATSAATANGPECATLVAAFVRAMRADIARIAPALLVHLDAATPPALDLPPDRVYTLDGADLIRLGAAEPLPGGDSLPAPR